MQQFINRTRELKILSSTKAKLVVLFGRRRIGKTALIEKWGAQEVKKFTYTQAIEGSEAVQIEQLTADLKDIIPAGILPRTWHELLATLSLIKEPMAVVIDEFPYLVRSNPSLPSILQNWVDHNQPDHMQLVLLGSSQTMMHGLFLQSDAPLYERADLILKLEPMSYRHFCEASACDPLNIQSFLKFSLIGGVPRYWRYSEDLETPIQVADSLFFDKSARLEDEPDRLLKDEGITGQQAKSIFESLGRGAERPSEIAGRMGMPQTALSKPLGILLHSNLVTRVVPFGESHRNTKRTLYRIDDYALRFWYQVYSPHRSRWRLYARDVKTKLLRDHAAKVLEDEFRKIYPEAAPYWQGQDLEIDCVRYASKNLKKLILTEIKLKHLSVKEKAAIVVELEGKFKRSSLAKEYDLDHIEALGINDILEILAAAK